MGDDSPHGTHLPIIYLMVDVAMVGFLSLCAKQKWLLFFFLTLCQVNKMLTLQSINVMETILEGLGLHKCHIQLRVVGKKG